MSQLALQDWRRERDVCTSHGELRGSSFLLNPLSTFSICAFIRNGYPDVMLESGCTSCPNPALQVFNFLFDSVFYRICIFVNNICYTCVVA